jgi:DNA helicase-2/ATP-dependent DNA helicase PcrA
MKTYRLDRPQPKSQLDYESALNPQQLAAVMAGDGPQLIIAGAGSGKTRTLTYRVARLIERGVPADSIALCTFTNKAAREMLQRVEHLVADRGRQVWGGTFHHLANRLLRDVAAVIGYQPEFSILDAEDAKDLLGDCLADGQTGKRSKKLSTRPGVLGGLLGLSINTLTPLDQIVIQYAPSLTGRLHGLLDAARKYRDRKQRMNVMDFDDLLYNLHRALQDEQVGAGLAGRFEHVLVDEYQDTTPLQAALVDALAKPQGNPSVVGDDAQSIYGFRGADPANILSFTERWPDAQIHKLEKNYRSSPQVLNLANASITHNVDQLQKTLTATRPDGELPALVPVRDADMEAAFVAQRICDFVDQGLGLSDMAVLYRAHHHSMQLQVELTRHEIPYLVRSGVRFFEQAHIKDVLAHLRLVLNPKEELSWLRVLRLQTGIGRTGAGQIWDRIARSDDPLSEAMGRVEADEIANRNRAGWLRVRKLLLRLDEPDARQHASVAITAVLEGAYGELLPGLYNNPDGRRDDIEQLAQYADRFDDPLTFLAELNLLASFASETVMPAQRPDEMLTLSSIHQAKGLEWGLVFVLSLNEGSFPHPRSLAEQGGLEEERRLFYVACTRTKESLHLLTRQVDDRAGRHRVLLQPSRFLDEVSGHDLYERWVIEG